MLAGVRWDDAPHSKEVGLLTTLTGAGLANADECARVRALYVRVVQMLTKLDAALV